MTYSYPDLLQAYREVGIAPGQLVYATSNLMGVADFETRGSRPLAEAHFQAVREILGETGTLVVPTRSMQICNTDKPFDPSKTPCNIGTFPEFVRKQPEAIRSFHPFNSYTAIGARAEEIVSNVSRHAYGPETPEARLIEADALCVCIGVQPNISCSTVHHVEQVMAVPYRYIKEFVHPVIRKDKVEREPFYMHVWYQDIKVKNDRNKKLFDRFDGQLAVHEVKIGRGLLYSYSIRQFYDLACRVFADDIYTWCDRPPEIRPYTK